MSNAASIDPALEVPFGLDKAKLAADLQWLADEIRGGRIFPQASESATKNIQDDFELKTLSITYAEPKP